MLNAVLGGSVHIKNTSLRQVERALMGMNGILSNKIDSELPLRLAQRLDEDKFTVMTTGISGQTASGKSTIIKSAVRKLLGLKDGEPIPQNDLALIIDGDRYFKDRSKERSLVENFEDLLKNGLSFDKESSANLQQARADLTTLTKKQPVHLPIYDYTTCAQSMEEALTYPSNLVGFDSIFALSKTMQPLDLTMMVKVPQAKRLMRYMGRAIKERGMNEQSATALFEAAKEEFEKNNKRAKPDLVILGAKPLEVIIDPLTELMKVLSRA